MISTPLKVFIVVAGLGAGAAALGVLHLENRRLARRIAAARVQAYDAVTLRRDNTALQAIVTASRARTPDALPAQLAAARAEVAALEQRAAQQAAQEAAEAQRDRADLANNRDPRLGLTRLEYFQPAGRATPAAAFQTAVWAAMKGDEPTLMQVSTMVPATRAEAEQLIARLPDAARGQWTPKKLTALWVSSALNDVSAIEITDEAFSDPQHAVVTFRFPERQGVEHVNLRLAADGWQVVLPANAMQALERRINDPKR